MKKLLWIVALFTLAWACKDDEKTPGPGPGDFYLDLSKESVLAWDTLTYVQIDVSTNGEFWDVQADSTAPWCEPSMNDTKEDRSITLRIAPNGDAGEREAEIKVYGEDSIVKTIKVKQMGTDPSIIYHAVDLDKISDDSVRLIIDIEANMEYEVIIPSAYQSWLSWDGTEEGDRIRNYFTVSRNLGEPRDGMILLKGVQYPEIEEEISLHQLAYNSEYSPVDPGDIGKTKDIKIKIVSATTTSVENRSDAAIVNIFDGSYTYGWHSRWGAGQNNDFPITLVLTLEENQNTLDYLMYYPRAPRGNGTPGLVDIDYTTADDPDNYKVFGKYDFEQSPDTRKLTPPEPIVAPAKIRMIIRSGYNGYGSIQEMEAWEMALPDPLLTSIFTDSTYSALNPGVTYEMISQLTEPFLFNIAKHLLAGDYPVAERVREYLPYRHPDNVAKELKTSTYSLYDNPTGIYFRPMDDVVVFVGPTNGEQVSIRIADHVSGDLQEEIFALQEGENKFTSRYGGLAYIDYYTENSGAPVKVHVASGLVNGLFDVTKHTNSDWQRILDNAVFAALDVVGEKMHLVFEVEDWKTISNPVELITAWDDIVRLEQELMGLVKFNRVPRNRVFGQVDNRPTANYMDAVAYRTRYSKGTIRNLVNADKVRSSDVWGPAHEIGHVNQVRPGMKWIGTTEVTNNIYSLYVQTQFGNVARLTASRTYEQAFSELMLPEVAHGSVEDPFVKLVPFWQLQLYAQSVGKSDAYYPELFENMRRFADKTDNGEMQLDYVKYSCQLLQLDLTDFFVAWGFLREADLTIEDYSTGTLKITAAQVDEVKSTIAGYGGDPAPVTLPYLTDTNVEFLKNRQAVVTGTAGRSGQRITTTGWQNVMVYKTYYGGSVVYISADPSFNIPDDYPAESAEIKAVQWDGTEIAVTF